MESFVDTDWFLKFTYSTTKMPVNMHILQVGDADADSGCMVDGWDGDSNGMFGRIVPGQLFWPQATSSIESGFHSK